MELPVPHADEETRTLTSECRLSAPAIKNLALRSFFRREDSKEPPFAIVDVGENFRRMARRFREPITLPKRELWVFRSSGRHHDQEIIDAAGRCQPFVSPGHFWGLLIEQEMNRLDHLGVDKRSMNLFYVEDPRGERWAVDIHTLSRGEMKGWGFYALPFGEYLPPRDARIFLGD